jgi:predicted N-acetyltransferase YhbS
MALTAPAMTGEVLLAPERALDAPLAGALIEDAFGPGRYAKAAERLREGATPVRELSFLAWLDQRAVGCVRLWPIVIGERAALLLGPLAVETEFRGAGVGAALVERACEEAAAAGYGIVLLVGDEAYFGPVGFSVAAGVIMPGPVDPRRVLVRELVAGDARNLAGTVRAAPSPAVARVLQEATS